MVRWGGCTSKTTDPLPPQRVTQALGGSDPPPQRVAFGLGGSRPPPPEGATCSGGVEIPFPPPLAAHAQAPGRGVSLGLSQGRQTEILSTFNLSVTVRHVCKWCCREQACSESHYRMISCTMYACLPHEYCGVTVKQPPRPASFSVRSNCKSPTSWTFSVMSDWLSAETQAVAFSSG